MSVFENKIKRNRADFDQKEPELGHMERFISKLDQAGFKQRYNFPLKLAYKIAAGFSILIVAGFLLAYLLNKNSDEMLVNSIEYSSELNNILAYYDAVSLEKVNEIDQLVEDNDQAEMLKQTAVQRLEDIDGSLASIEKELSKNPENENIKATIINIKRKKVKVMDDILTQLDFANTSLF
jgi:hypothetical protein